ncbi:ABC transporter permease [Bosea massiliensis]|uniref:ABC transporter permease n=1 Tax=Bosea massiliensis TaxID=151419 RepID=A0ABW0P7H0_9HYPH
MHGFARIGRTLRRTAFQAVPTILGIVVLNFFLLQLAPGDAADVLAGEAGSATEETMAALRQHLGLDQPVLTQLVTYLTRLAHWDLGFSSRFGMPVSELIAERIAGTLQLMIAALLIAITLGLLLGSVMASWAGQLPDRVLSVLSQLMYSIPNFWIGLMLIVLFSVKLGWLPSGGAETIGAENAGLAGIVDRLRHMVLPVTSLALFYIAIYARLTRAAMLEVRSLDFVRTAVAKGLTPLRVTTHHVLRNALMPVTTMAGMHIGGVLGGAVVVETVYSWPGMGRLAFEAVMGRDTTVLLGILLLSAILVILANLAVDLLQLWLDPRIGDR